MTDAASDPAPLRVLVVDADERTRESLVGLLRIGRRCTVVGGAGNQPESLALVMEFAPDVLVIDPRLPELDAGRALIARVRELSPGTRVLVMGLPDPLARNGFADLGDAFVRKTFRPRELVDAVVAVGAGRPA